MTLALTSPSIVEGLIAVDNAPIRIPMSDDFANYIRGMKAIEDTRVSSRSQADEILCAYEPVSNRVSTSSHTITVIMSSPWLSVSFFLPTLKNPLERTISSSQFLWTIFLPL